MKNSMISLTNHARERSAHRAINRQMIQDTIDYGQMIRKQGLRYFVMTEKCIPDQMPPQYQERVKNTVVILTPDNAVMTVYKNEDALKHIKRKPKRLERYKVSHQRNAA